MGRRLVDVGAVGVRVAVRMVVGRGVVGVVVVRIMVLVLVAGLAVVK